MEASKSWFQGWAWILPSLVSSLAEVWFGLWQEEFLRPPLGPTAKKLKLIKDAIP